MSDVCETCGGDRVVFEDRFDHATGHYTVDVPCPDCADDDDREPDNETINMPDVSDDRLKDPFL